MQGKVKAAHLLAQTKIFIHLGFIMGFVTSGFEERAAP